MRHNVKGWRSAIINSKHKLKMEDKIKDILLRRGALHVIHGNRFYTEQSVFDAINEALSQPSVSGSLLTPRQVDDKFTKEWAEPRVGEYEYCSTAQVLAWGYREGYNEARKDLSNYR